MPPNSGTDKEGEGLTPDEVEAIERERQELLSIWASGQFVDLSDPQIADANARMKALEIGIRYVAEVDDKGNRVVTPYGV
ncbi:hypothetical protein [Ktedonospora formicarum]|uniref:Uncharacterized protein n=1 Tax=Ktedonospora formicarum TaxID=2778364 RepID=A0A8J3I973_9CHLR|nr:hypothetical protein [Ktedonospora formicarum]GHO50961.1 hypothetical protein KSX_91240 [Ktedonospora formicarum]